MLERITNRFTKRRVDTAKTIYKELVAQDKVTKDSAAAASVLVENNNKQKLISKKFSPKDVMVAGQELVDALNNPTFPHQLKMEAEPVLPALAEELQKAVTKDNEIGIDEKTTVIQPAKRGFEVDVSRRGFLKTVRDAAAIVGVTPVASTATAGYFLVNYVAYADQQQAHYLKELNESKAKFDAAYPEKPLQFVNPEEIQNTLQYNHQIDFQIHLLVNIYLPPLEQL